ncbi:Exodeoxyribonuclease III [hydrothermal vent metagenome]|uniref:Exodeoxyribonuclease III n=1 Tax=hydrothermal vent metagenome TaxID=652676 RepID=A0A3B0TGX0_9ZZZZ
MKLISWNVNGIRAAIRKGFLDFVKKENPDILCLQETKAPKEGMTIDLQGYEQIWNDAKRPGYSGTAVFSKEQPIKTILDLKIEKHDEEGRVITTEWDDFYLVNVYVPNSKRGLLRLDYRYKEWDVDFLKYLKKLEKKKPVIYCGDMNVAHKEIDLKNPKTNSKNPGFTPQERESFDNIVDSGFIDTFREFETGGGHYTWWSQMRNCRVNNVGWRIDYFGISPILRKRLKKAFILPEVMGSDHCPVGIVLD